MKTKNILLIFLFLGLLTACHRPDFPENQKVSEKQTLANLVRKKAALHIEQTTGLHPCGTMGQMLHDIEKLGLSFQYRQPVDITEGRKLLIKATDILVKTINEEPRIHRYLYQYPFKPRNIELTIFLYAPDGNDLPLGSLDIIKIYDDYLKYEITHPITKHLTTVYKETYEEALERIADPSLPLVPFKPNSEISQETLMKIWENIYFLSDDGSQRKLGENGAWTKD